MPKSSKNATPVATDTNSAIAKIEAGAIPAIASAKGAPFVVADDLARGRTTATGQPHSVWSIGTGIAFLVARHLSTIHGIGPSLPDTSAPHWIVTEER